MIPGCLLALALAQAFALAFALALALTLALAPALAPASSPALALALVLVPGQLCWRVFRLLDPPRVPKLASKNYKGSLIQMIQ